MRIPGRFWWVAALGACACGAGVVVLPFMGLTGSVARDASLGISIEPDIAIIVLYSAMCLALSGILVWYTAGLLARYRRRRRAIAGDLQAMPAARVDSPPSNVPDLTAEPLLLQWRVKRPLVVFESLILGLKLLVPIGLCGAILYFNWQSLQQPSPHLPALGQALTMAICLLACGGIGVLGRVWIRMRWFQWRHAFGVIATQDGLTCVDDSGRRACVAWSDVRLFEVEAHMPTLATTHIWRLYGSQDFAEWSYYPPGSDFSPDTIPYAEAVRRTSALIAIVQARTSMQPRTLSKALMVRTNVVPILASHALS